VPAAWARSIARVDPQLGRDVAIKVLAGRVAHQQRSTRLVRA
jgi:hypothetical protein